MQQGQPPIYPWPGGGATGAFAGAGNGRLFNGFSYPGQLNLAGGDEPGRQGDLAAPKTSPPPAAVAQSGRHVFDFRGTQPSGTESVPMVGQSPIRRPSFPQLQQSPWAGGFSMVRHFVSF